MNEIQIQQNGVKVVQTSDYVEVNGQRHYFPPNFNGLDAKLVVRDGEVYVNGKHITTFMGNTDWGKRPKMTLTPFGKFVATLILVAGIGGLFALFKVIYKFIIW